MKSSFFDEKTTKKRLADFILKTKQHSMGKQCQMFEKSFAKKQKRKYAVYVSSGSMANLILLQSLINLGRLKKGDLVGVSALTWSTNVMPVIQMGLVPVVIDCNLNNLNVSSKTLSAMIDKIDALFITNVLGFCGDLSEIKKMCKKNGVLLLEDNCESLGSVAYKTLLGNFGLASTFSFFVGHHMSTIEGGMIVTDDDSLADMLKMTRAHGWDRNLDKKRQAKIREEHRIDDFYSKYTFYNLAYNGRPTEINGFLGNLQIKFLDRIINRRQANFRLFHKASLNNKNLVKLDVSHMDVVSNFAFPVVCKDKETCIKLKNRFVEQGVEIRPIIAGDISQQPFYKKSVRDEVSDIRLQSANFIHEHGFYFGNHPEMTKMELKKLVILLKNAE